MTTHDSAPRATAHHGRHLTLTLDTSATPEQVWRAWADPEILSQWFADRVRGEARTGATMTWIFEKFGYEFPYHVVEASPPSHLVLGGALPGRPPFLLEIIIRRAGGMTRLELVNSGFLDGGEWDEEYEGVFSGWQMALGILRHYLERYFGQPKGGFLAMQPADIALAESLPWFTDEQLLQRWLTDRGTLGEAGAPVDLRLASGDRVRGTVLARTKREIAVSWEDERVVLELKAFAAGPGVRMVAVRGTGWGVAPERLQNIESEMAAAVARLVAALSDATARQAV